MQTSAMAERGYFRKCKCKSKPIPLRLLAIKEEKLVAGGACAHALRVPSYSDSTAAMIVKAAF